MISLTKLELDSYVIPLTEKTEIGILPKKVWERIFGYLDHKEASTVALVCNSFNLMVMKPGDNAFAMAMKTQNLIRAWRILHNPNFDPVREKQAISYACAYGSLVFVDEILKNPKVDPSTQNMPLLLAFIREDFGIVKRLLQDPRLANPEGREIKILILYAAAEKGEIEILRVLMPKIVGIYQFLLSEGGIAALGGNDQAVQGLTFLKEKYEAEIENVFLKSLEVTDTNRRWEAISFLLSLILPPSLEILYAAARIADEEIFGELYAKTPANLLDSINYDDLLENACQSEDLKWVKTILQLIKDRDGDIDYCPSINIALSINHLEMVKFLMGCCNEQYHELQLGKMRYDAGDLSNACGNGYLELVQYFRSLPPEEFSGPLDFNESLLEAIEGDHLEVVEELLLDARVDPAANNNAPIRKAYHFGHERITEKLLSFAKVDPSAKNNEAVKQLAEKRRGEMMDSLLQDNRVKNTLSDEEKLQFQLYSASWKGDVKAVKELLENSNHNWLGNEQNKIVLGFAVEYNQLGVVQALLQNPTMLMDTNSNEAWGEILKIAASKGHLDITKELLQDSRNPKVADFYIEAIAAAAANGHLEIIHAFISYQENHPGQMTRPDVELMYHFALSKACKAGHLHIAERILIKLLPMVASNTVPGLFVTVKGYVEGQKEEEIAKFIRKRFINFYLDQIAS